MWSRKAIPLFDTDRARGSVAFRLSTILLLGALTAGCFQPLYASRSITTGAPVRDSLRAVDVSTIKAPRGSDDERLAVELRNSLLFNFTGGKDQLPPTHRLVTQISTTRLSVIVDVNTARPDIENYGVNATYTLVEIATGKEVVNGTAFARASYDVPGGLQRFARIRGQRDAGSRAAKEIAEAIRTRIAGFFASGT
jgi:LPS-assembly lipoprotein